MSAGLVKALALDKRKEIAALPSRLYAPSAMSATRVIGALGEPAGDAPSGPQEAPASLKSSFAAGRSDKHPKLLVVCEDTARDAVTSPSFSSRAGLGEDDILQVDSNRKGEMSQGGLGGHRERLFDIDRHKQPKVIVSV